MEKSKESLSESILRDTLQSYEMVGALVGALE